MNAWSGSVRDFVHNWRHHDASVAAKLRMTARNLFTKRRLTKGCCGHPGEPGC